MEIINGNYSARHSRVTVIQLSLRNLSLLVLVTLRVTELYKKPFIKDVLPHTNEDN